MTAPTRPDPLPRELLPGVFWLGACLLVRYHDSILHGYNSCYLVPGDECSAIVEGGHPKDIEVVIEQVEALLANGLPEVRYVFLTHTEPPHSSGVGRMLERFPEATACGDVSDLHLVFPQHSHRLRGMKEGEAINLGGTSLRVVEAVIRDMPQTRWAFDTRRRVLFPGDGFAYSHYHDAGHCGALAEEAATLDVPEMTGLFASLALYWTRFVDLEPYIARLDELLFDELDVQFIAPTHGLPIGDVKATLPAVCEGLRLGAASTKVEQLF